MLKKSKTTNLCSFRISDFEFELQDIHFKTSWLDILWSIVEAKDACKTFT